MEEKQYITAPKKIELEQELENLINTVRPTILKKLQFAKSLGDLSENAEYHAAREEQAKNENRISQIEYILKNAQIVEKKSGGKIYLGSTIVIQKKGGSEMEFTIVGPEEADMTTGKLSNTSPLGQAVTGLEEGGTASVQTPKGITEYSIVKVK